MSEERERGKRGRKIVRVQGQEINKAKEVLAYEVTKLIHGEEEAKKAEAGARAAFGASQDMSNLPTIEFDSKDLDTMEVLDLLVQNNLIKSKGEGRKLIKQNGLTVKGKKTDRQKPRQTKVKINKRKKTQKT